MADLSILHLYPQTLRLNGESGNVVALSVRATAMGLAVKLSAVDVGEPLPSKRPHVVFLGSGTLAGTLLAAADLQAKSDVIHQWVAKGTKVLAVGSGFDLVSQGLDLLDGSHIDCLGLTNTSHAITTEHLSGEVALSSGLAGFINSNRAIRRGTGKFDLGEVVASDISAIVGYVDGYRDGKVMASNVQGPLLPMNPTLADELISWVYPNIQKTEDLKKYDRLASKARAAIASRVGN
jgi:CobQ-like glutamine amidotransferase family enzyme